MIGVQSEAAPAAYRSWKEGVIAEDRVGHRPPRASPRGSGFELPQQILRERLSDFVLVSEDDLREATLHMLERTPDLIEACGRRAARRGVAARPRRQEGRPDRQRREHDVRPASRATRVQIRGRISRFRPWRATIPRSSTWSARPRSSAFRTSAPGAHRQPPRSSNTSTPGQPTRTGSPSRCSRAPRRTEPFGPAGRSSSRPPGTRASASRSPRRSRATR